MFVYSKEAFVMMINAEEGQSMAYPQAEVMAKSLVPIMSEYKCSDIARCVFCINSWYQNRSFQTATIALNAALTMVENFGSKQIETFEEFTDFFTKIKKYCISSSFEDEVVPVMGQVKLLVSGKWRSVIYGCGMTREYPKLCFAGNVCAYAHKENSFETLVDYVEEMCLCLEGGGWKPEQQSAIKLFQPARSHWEATKKWFERDSASLLPDDIYQVLGDESKPIENKHFFRWEDKTIPLFNASILIDYYSYCCGLIEETDLLSLVNQSLIKQVMDEFPSHETSKQGFLAHPCFKVGGEFLQDCPSVLLLVGEDENLTLFYNAETGEGSLDQVISLFRSRNGGIDVAEPPFFGRPKYGITIPDPSRMNLTIVELIDDSAPTTVPCPVVPSDFADSSCFSTDLMAMLQIASSIEEINSFFRYLASKKHHYFRLFSSVSDSFICWRENNRQMLPGAEDRETSFNIICDFNETDYYYLSLFSELLVDYPCLYGNYVMGSPFSRNFCRNQRGFLEIQSKSDSEYLGVTKRFGGDKSGFCHIALELNPHSFSSSNDLEAELSIYDLVKDSLCCFLNDATVEVGELCYALGGLAKLEYVPKDDARSNGFRLLNKELGLYGALKSEGHVIQFAVDRDALLQALTNTNDRSVECDFATALFSLYRFSTKNALAKLNMASEQIKPRKKKIDMSEFELPYVWNGPTGRNIETDISRSRALKEIAYSADRVGIQSKEYFGKEANVVLRGFQSDLVEVLHDELRRYEAASTIANLYEMLANALHEFYYRTLMFDRFNDLDQEEADRINELSMEQREEAKEQTRAIQYCIETIMAFGLSGEGRASAQDLSYVVSLASQIVMLCDTADLLYFNPLQIGVEVASNKTVSVIQSKALQLKNCNLKNRQLTDSGYVSGSSTDIEYLRKAKRAFKKDTSISFDCFLDVVRVLAYAIGFSQEDYRRLNVIKLPREKVYETVEKVLEGAWEINMIEACLNLLTLTPGDLMTVQGKKYDYLPFGRMKDRATRFELCPIIPIDNTLLFSPVSLGMLSKRWVNGLMDMFIPAKEFYKHTYQVLVQWKRHYEKQLEKDAHGCFVSVLGTTNYVFKNLHLDRKGNHPQYLGDYDVLAYVEKTNTLWIVECKQFEKVESSYDYMQLQKRWFGEKGKLQKFERRIKYIIEHSECVLRDLSLPCVENLQYKSVLVCNKLFVNMLNESSFDVITLSELEVLLRESLLK